MDKRLLVIVLVVAAALLIFIFPKAGRKPYLKVQSLSFEKSGNVYDEKISVSPGTGFTLHAILEETGGVDTSLTASNKCLCSFGISNSSMSWTSSFACDKSMKASSRKTLSENWDGLVHGSGLAEGNYKIFVSCDNSGNVERMEKDLIVKFNATNEECKDCIVT